MHLITRYPYQSLFAATSVALLLFLMFTNPDKVSVGLLVLPAMLLFLLVFSVAQMFMRGLGLLRKKPRKQRTVALIAASLISVTIILQSTGGISAADVILLGLIISVITLYIDKF